MTCAKSSVLHLFVLFISLFITKPAFTQQTLTDYEGWSQKLSSTKDIDNENYYTLIAILTASDSASVFNFVHHLEAVTKQPNSHFKARLYCLTLDVTILFQPRRDHAEYILLTKKALDEASKSEDESLIACTYFLCGTIMASIQEMEYTVTYLLNGQEMYDRIGQKTSKQYYKWIIIGEVLFHCHEFEKSIFYTHKGINAYQDTGARPDYFRARFNNTLGQDYEKLSYFDSAFTYYKKSLQLSEKVNDSVWIGINNGFIGDILYKEKKYQQALPHLRISYALNKSHEYAHAAKSLQYMARINLEEGKKDSAVLKSKEALRLMETSGPVHYLQQQDFLDLVYETNADAYRAIGDIDSFYHYNDLYISLHDSLQKVATLSSIKMTQLRIENGDYLRATQTLQKERRNEILKRNFLIVALIMLTVIVFLYFNRMRLKQFHKDEIAKAELNSAREQMEVFTTNIQEKTSLLEKLNEQIAIKEKSSEQNLLLQDIANHTILTEEDWNKFKSLFEKIYPGFFINLKKKAPDITVAEQRMAALTRLNITSRQMASMLGISVDSIHKTRQRLRSRLHMNGEESLEKAVAGL
jgi:tetratricopeptide (TPR) repeat protein/DNA-binding CsgD family transcriptional regulator